jgi:hypothetical protein
MRNWARALKNFRQPCPRPKKIKECRFEGGQINSLPGVPACLGPALGAGVKFRPGCCYRNVPQSVRPDSSAVLQVRPRRISYTSSPVHGIVSALTTLILVLQTCGSSGRSYTYGQTRALCRRFANALLGAVGLRQGDVLGLLLPNIPEYVIAIHGAIEAGIVVTFANPLYTPGGLGSFSTSGF